MKFSRSMVLFALGAVLGTNPAYAAKYLYIEAETGTSFSPVVVKAGKDASKVVYVAPWKFADYTSRSNDDGRINFDVYVPEAGTYKLWARSKVSKVGESPYYVGVAESGETDNLQWTSWAADNRNSNQLNQWAWSNSGVSFNLSVGKHTLRLIQKAGGPSVQLDKILLTNDGVFVPNGAGGDEPMVTMDNPYKAASVQKYGQLKLVGTQLSDQNGNAVQLKGISAHGLQWHQLVKRQSIPNMAQFFGIDLVRLAMYVEDFSPTDNTDYWGGYMADPAAQKARTIEAIDDAIAAGLYVMVDWHIHNKPLNYTNEAVAFFKQISAKYAAYPNVIYEICNEPVGGLNWSTQVKPYAEQVIAAIRANDPDNIIVVGTPTWSQDVDAASADPLRGDNIMYSLHYYAASHDLNTFKNKMNTAMSRGAALFVSEWGTSDVGVSRTDFNAAQQFMSYVNEKKLSWVQWSLGNKDEASSIIKPNAPMSGPWSTADLTAAGTWIKPYFNPPQAASGSGGSNTGSNTGSTSRSSSSAGRSSSSSSSPSSTGGSGTTGSTTCGSSTFTRTAVSGSDVSVNVGDCIKFNKAGGNLQIGNWNGAQTSYDITGGPQGVVHPGNTFLQVNAVANGDLYIKVKSGPSGSVNVKFQYW